MCGEKNGCRQEPQKDGEPSLAGLNRRFTERRGWLQKRLPVPFILARTLFAEKMENGGNGTGRARKKRLPVHFLSSFISILNAMLKSGTPWRGAASQPA